MKRVLITGINGMLGSVFSRFFSGQYSIAGIHRDTSCLTKADEEYICDIRDENKILAVIDDFKPDIILHCAGLVNMELCEEQPELAYEVNVTGTRNLLNNEIKNIKFVYISTDQVYGSSENHKESNNKINQLNQYGRTKYLGEKEVLQSANNAIIARTNIFGWNVKNDKKNSAEWMYETILDGSLLHLFEDYTFSPIYGFYLAEILNVLLQRDFSGIINIGSRNICSKYEFGIEMCRLLKGDEEKLIPKSISDYHFRAMRNHDLSLNTEKLLNLGIEVPTWEESLKAFIKDKNHVT